jgi:hypothetical protein
MRTKLTSLLVRRGDTEVRAEGWFAVLCVTCVGGVIALFWPLRSVGSQIGQCFSGNLLSHDDE